MFISGRLLPLLIEHHGYSSAHVARVISKIKWQVWSYKVYLSIVSQKLMYTMQEIFFNLVQYLYKPLV